MSPEEQDFLQALRDLNSVIKKTFRTAQLIAEHTANEIEKTKTLLDDIQHPKPKFIRNKVKRP